MCKSGIAVTPAFFRLPGCHDSRSINHWLTPIVVPAGFSRMKSRKLWLIVLLFAGVPLFLVWLWNPEKPPASVYPTPNGYDDFIAAGDLVVRVRPIPDNLADWRVHHSANVAALAKMREGLSKTCMSSNMYDSTGFKVLSARYSSFKDLAHAQRAEFEVALADGDTNFAVRSAIDGIRFGIESARGGVMIEGLVSIAVQKIAMIPFRPIISSLSRTNAEFALEQMLSLETNAPSARSVLDKESSARPQMSESRWHYAIYMIFRHKAEKVGEKKFTMKYHEFVNERRQIGGLLAKRLYELKHGKPAIGWTDLVPRFLPAIQKDAETGSDLPFP